MDKPETTATSGKRHRTNIQIKNIKNNHHTTLKRCATRTPPIKVFEKFKLFLFHIRHPPYYPWSARGGNIKQNHLHNRENIHCPFRNEYFVLANQFVVTTVDILRAMTLTLDFILLKWNGREIKCFNVTKVNKYRT